MVTKLRAVKDGETAPPQKALTILEAAELGDRLEELRSMRRRIAKALDDPNTPARDLAALSRRQIEIGRDVDMLELRANEEARRERSASTTSRGFDSAAI